MLNQPEEAKQKEKGQITSIPQKILTQVNQRRQTRDKKKIK